MVPKRGADGMGDEGFLIRERDLGVAERTSMNIFKNGQLIAVTQELQNRL